MSRYILIDGGQGGCRIVYLADGKQILTGNGAGLGRRARDRSAGVLRVLERAFADLVADGVRKLVRTGRVVVTNDAVTSYLGAIGFEPGAVVAAGTGVIALAGDRDGNFARSDGWGYVLGDDGGGYYIGRLGLASALRAHDGRGGSQALLQRAKDEFGKPESLRDLVYSSPNPAGEVAGFAREVAEAARGGDSVAEEIWAIAAREVAQTATAALSRVFAPDAPVSVSWTGNLFEARDLMLQPFQRQVVATWPKATLLAPTGTALSGAELLARLNRPHMFEDLLHVFGIPPHRS
jgi:N-acetylglucosamine kinase-like BadF-type ATPase